jgi:hypothetical protein
MEFVAVIGRQCSLENCLEATLGRIALISLVSARDYMPQHKVPRKTRVLSPT